MNPNMIPISFATTVLFFVSVFVVS